MVRDDITAALSGAVMIPNSVLRVMADAKAALAHLVLRYIDWLARQLLPDTAEKEWLERHGQIWLTNSDGSRGRKAANCAHGTVTLTGTNGTVVPSGTRLMSNLRVTYETVEAVTVGADATPVAILAIDAGVAGNMEPDETLDFIVPIQLVDVTATIVTLTGGTEEETIDDLRTRVLERIQQPPMGGDAEDYVAWTLRVPGVTRAWSAPLEMGIGTVTVRFMCDDLRLSTAGFPLQEDIDVVTAYLDKVRPVTVKDFFVVAPIPEPINFRITKLDKDEVGTRAAIEAAVRAMLYERARPAYAREGILQNAQMIYAAWVSEAIMHAAGVNYFDLVMDDHEMPSHGHMAVLGTISYG